MNADDLQPGVVVRICSESSVSDSLHGVRGVVVPTPVPASPWPWVLLDGHHWPLPFRADEVEVAAPTAEELRALADELNSMSLRLRTITATLRLTAVTYHEWGAVKSLGAADRALHVAQADLLDAVGVES